MADYYKTLNIKRDASQDEINKSYRRLAMKYHPDRSKSSKDQEKFKEITQAYEVLGDPQKRANYDRFGAEGAQNYNANQNSNFNFNQEFNFGGSSQNFEDIFGSFFGEHRAQGKKGRDLSYTLSLTLQEAYHGCTKVVQYSCITCCSHCKGKGGLGGTCVCPQCRGRGVQDTILGISMACRTCNGSGKTYNIRCHHCGGAKVVRGHKECKVEIPKGFGPENKIVYRQKGEDSSTGESGDLHVQAKIESPKGYKLVNRDIYYEMYIDMFTACLGGEKTINILGTQETINIKPHTQSNAQMILRGKGMPRLLRGQFNGNFVIQLFIEVPKTLDSESKEILLKLRESVSKKKV